MKFNPGNEPVEFCTRYIVGQLVFCQYIIVWFVQWGSESNVCLVFEESSFSFSFFKCTFLFEA